MKLIESLSKKPIIWIIIAVVIALYVAAAFFMWPVNITQLVELKDNPTVL